MKNKLLMFDETYESISGGLMHYFSIGSTRFLQFFKESGGETLDVISGSAVDGYEEKYPRNIIYKNKSGSFQRMGDFWNDDVAAAILYLYGMNKQSYYSCRYPYENSFKERIF